MPQSLREKTVDRLKRENQYTGGNRVAARGLDVDRISHVLNFDAPFDLNHTPTELGEPAGQGEGDAIIQTGKEVRMLKATTVA